MNDFYKFIWSCGGYHSKEIRKRNTPKSWKSIRIRSIKKGVLGTPLIYFRVRCLGAILPQGTQTVREVDQLVPTTL